MKKSLIPLFLLSFISVASADEPLQPIEVKAPSEPRNHGKKGSADVRDSAQLLHHEPGVFFQSGGGISSLPIIHGMADDRVNIKVDGAQITSSCPNHMNPALSYLEPEKIESIEVFAGITPVSQGGDSLGGSIVVKTNKLKFAETPDTTDQELKLKTFYRSNNETRGATLHYSVATDKNYVRYEGLDERANNYRNGRGKRLKSTLYNRNNQGLTLGHKLVDGEVFMKYMHTIVPYEGFINQRMDMEDNVSNHLVAGYKGSLGRLFLDSSVYYQHTNHYMDKISSQRDGEMPMYTRSDEAGYNVKFFYDLSKGHVLSFGSDFNSYRLDDWWPSLPGVTNIMGPGTFQSINNGKRERLGLFVESDSDWTPTFSTSLGVRADFVKMNTSNVHGYNDTDNLPADAAHFNAKSHDKLDQNLDVTLTSKTKVTPNFDFEFGVARKSRSPNLYERYAWAGTVTDPTDMMDMSSMGAAMDMFMINWFGDGNGYVGDINLKPEVAHKISSSFVFHDEGEEEWEVRFTPYFSDIKNFIDADLVGTSMGANFLRFANHDAVVFGADLALKARLHKSKNWGETSIRMISSYTRGYRKDGGGDLYHLMPLNGKITLKQTHDRWSGEITTHLVDKKEQVNKLRNEPTTPGYVLVDVGTSYQFSKFFNINLGVSNIFDHHYSLPLGGVDLVNYENSSRTPVGGMGRSYNIALNFEFL